MSIRSLSDATLPAMARREDLAEISPATKASQGGEKSLIQQIPALQIEDFEDFRRATTSAVNVFYEATPVGGSQVRVKAFAAGKAWGGDFPAKEAARYEKALKDLGAMKVKGYVDMEKWFR